MNETNELSNLERPVFWIAVWRPFMSDMTKALLQVECRFVRKWMVDPITMLNVVTDRIIEVQMTEPVELAPELVLEKAEPYLPDSWRGQKVTVAIKLISPEGKQ